MVTPNEGANWMLRVLISSYMKLVSSSLQKWLYIAFQLLLATFVVFCCSLCDYITSVFYDFYTCTDVKEQNESGDAYIKKSEYRVEI